MKRSTQSPKPGPGKPKESPMKETTLNKGEILNQPHQSNLNPRMFQWSKLKSPVKATKRNTSRKRNHKIQCMGCPQEQGHRHHLARTHQCQHYGEGPAQGRHSARKA